MPTGIIVTYLVFLHSDLGISDTLGIMFTTLKRYPDNPKSNLQAWDSADELILSYLAAFDLSEKRILIVNDAFGALSCALNQGERTTYTDSYVSHRALMLNSKGERGSINNLDQLSGIYDLVLIKLPKNLSFLEDILCHLSQHLQAGSKLVCGAMLKHLSPAVFPLLQKYIGETTTSLAEKKARLVFAEFQREPVESPYPLEVEIEGFAHPFTNHSNLFSREKLDAGTKFLLAHLPEGSFSRILDLGCGNGILGIAAKKRSPEAQIVFSDESQLALLSAQANYAKFFSDSPELVWTNGFEDQPRETLDLVLCNPPFHQETTIGDFIAWQMFVDARRALKIGGMLRVIGNSHLGYHLKLKRIFGKSKIVASNERFMIVDAVKIALK